MTDGLAGVWHCFPIDILIIFSSNIDLFDNIS